MDSRYVVQVFVGRNLSLEGAVEHAVEQINEWEPLQMRTADGLPCTRLDTCVTAKDGTWVCTITALGIERRERAYTGKTERLG